LQRPYLNRHNAKRERLDRFDEVRYDSRMLTRLALAVLLVFAASAARADGRYSADRYDSRIEVLDGGTIRVTETIAVRFESGTFTQFYRAVPVRRTDGIEIITASMDGERLPPGTGPRQVEVSGSSNVRVTWHFPQTSGSTRTFELTYLVHGVVRQEADGDLLAWRILPTEHRYPIASSTADLLIPVAPAAIPAVDTHRVDDSKFQVSDRHLRITTTAIRSNGWVETSVHFPRGSVVDAPPAWQRHQQDVNALAGTWIASAAIIALAGLTLLFVVRQQYDPPPHDFSPSARTVILPDRLPPVMAGTLLTNGSPRLEQAMAGLFSLAERGVVRIDEQPRRLGQRQFALTRVPSAESLSPYDEKLVEIIFSPDSHAGAVSLGKARNRLVRQFRKFKTALEPAMSSAGLLDPDRQAVRRRFAQVAGGSLIAAGIAAVALATLVERFGAWPMLIAGALALVGFVGLISFAAHTPLSNDGVRRADRWREFRQYLRDVARDRQPSPAEAAIRELLPYAIALGLAQSWSSYLKKHRNAVPAWFRAMSATSNDSAIAFSVFVGSGGTGAGSAHGAAGGAAGGGASGAS
jgi:predicted membrane protein DUF2207